MSTATNRFFNIAELIYLTTCHLDKTDTSRLSRTCRRLHHWIKPALFEDITVRYDPHGTNILASPDSLRALSRNIPVVRSLSIGLSETVFLYSCFRAFETGLIATTDITFVSASQPPALATVDIVPLPPMNMLAELTVFLIHTARDDSCPYLPTLTGDTWGEFERTCWLLRMSEHLVKLEVNRLTVHDRQEFVVLARALASIPRLEELCLAVIVNNRKLPRFPTMFEVWSELFFVCPRSLRKNKVELHDCEFDLEGGDSVDEQQRVQTDLAALRRQGGQEGQGHLLPHLKELVLGVIDDFVTAEEDVRKVLEQCPNLESLQCREMAPTVFSENGDLGRIVATSCCPFLKKVSFEYASSDNYAFPYQLMMEIQEQQVEEFKWDSHHRPLQGPGAIRMFSRHSTTLRNIDFGRRVNVSSDVLCYILSGCSALEELSAQLVGIPFRRRQPHASFISLDHAVKNPWACTRMRRLELAVTIPPLPQIADLTPYYRRTATTATGALSDEERQYFRKLERMYRQIGALSQLTHLKLKAYVMDGRDGVGGPMAAYFRNTFPALLSLGDADKGSGQRPGYLDCLAGLTKLRELRGSVCATTEETKVTMGWPEARWMAKHWPNLEAAGFFGMRDMPTEPFLWLQSESKGGRLNVSTIARTTS